MTGTVCSEILRRGPRGEGQIDLLLDRQRIHVGAQRHDAAGLAALQHAHDAGDPDACLHLVAELLQMRGGERGGTRLLIGKLRVLVNVAAATR